MAESVGQIVLPVVESAALLVGPLSAVYPATLPDAVGSACAAQQPAMASKVVPVHLLLRCASATSEATQ